MVLKKSVLDKSSSSVANDVQRVKDAAEKASSIITAELSAKHASFDASLRAQVAEIQEQEKLASALEQSIVRVSGSIGVLRAQAKNIEIDNAALVSELKGLQDKIKDGHDFLEKATQASEKDLFEDSALEVLQESMAALLQTSPTDLVKLVNESLANLDIERAASDEMLERAFERDAAVNQDKMYALFAKQARLKAAFAEKVTLQKKLGVALTRLLATGQYLHKQIDRMHTFAKNTGNSLSSEAAFANN